MPGTRGGPQPLGGFAFPVEDLFPEGPYTVADRRGAGRLVGAGGGGGLLRGDRAPVVGARGHRTGIV